MSVAHPSAERRVGDINPSSPTSGPVGVRSTGHLCPIEKHQFALGGNSSKDQQLPHKTSLCGGLEVLGMLRDPIYMTFSPTLCTQGWLPGQREA